MAMLVDYGAVLDEIQAKLNSDDEPIAFEGPPSLGGAAFLSADGCHHHSVQPFSRRCVRAQVWWSLSRSSARSVHRRTT